MKALHARRGLLAITTIGGVLASALAALPAHAVTSAGTTTSANTRASAGATARAVRQQVAPAPVTPGPAVPLPAARQAMLLALARESWLRGQPGSQAGPAGPAGAALAAASLRAGGLAAEQRRTGALTGVVRGPGGRAVTGACVTATGPSGSTTSRSRADGRYIMSGLPPGEYALRVSHCAGAAGGTGGVAAVTALWPGLPAQVTLGTGQVKSLPPVTVPSRNGPVSNACSTSW